MKKRVILKTGRAAPFIQKHPWVFSGAVDKIDDSIQNGDFVNVLDYKGKLLGQGLFNGNSSITVRLFHFFDESESFENILKPSLRHAIELRKTLYHAEQTNALRLINGEGDFLPGLICDLYKDQLVFQFNSLGLYQRKMIITQLVIEYCREILGINMRTTIDRTPDKIITLEGIQKENDINSSHQPVNRTEIKENGFRFYVDLQEGQKTGFYTDQRNNRRVLAQLLKGQTGYDLFCYTGGFSVNLAGNNSVTAVDSSRSAVEIAQNNLKVNGLSAQVIHDDVFSFLSDIAPCDFINADPPKYIAHEKDRKSGMKKYRQLYETCMNKIKNHGILAASSCSGLLNSEDFLTLLGDTALVAGKMLQLIYRGGAGMDYPASVHCPEGDYLKFFVFRVIHA